MSEAASPKYRLWIPAAIVLVFAILAYLPYAGESTLRVVFSAMAVMAGLFFLGVWWTFFTGRFRWRFMLISSGAVILAIVLAALTLRYEGAADGANPLQFAWRWSEPVEAGLDTLPVEGAQEPAPTETAVVDDPDLINFPSFLGPEMDGRVENIGISENLEAEELWRQRIGIGWAGFAVSGHHALTLEQRGDQELVTCHDLQTGELIWSHTENLRFSEAMGGDGPRSTPTIVEDVVYAQGATGLMLALNLQSGEVIWSTDVLAQISAPNIDWGKANSPLVLGNLVIVSGGKSEGAALVALNRENGEIVWKSGDGPASYSTPCLLELAGKEQIVYVAGDNVAGYDPATGTQLWRFSWPGPHPKVAQPLKAAADQLLVTASYGIDSHLLKLTQAGEGEEWSVEPIWSQKQMKTKFSSALLLDGIAYGLDEGKMIAMDVETGDRLWKGGRYGFGQNLLVGEELILVQTERGDVVLVKPTPEEHLELASLPALSSKTWNAAALAGRYLLVRNDREAVCYKLK